MKKIILLVLISLGVVATNAQNRPEKKFNKNNIEALKVAYITRQLNLTPEEAQKFWPVHNMYFEELKKTRRENLDNELVFEEKALNVRKKYNSDFRKILMSDERVNKLFKLEKDFNNELRKELMNRRMNNPNFKKGMNPPPTSNNND
jgi:hypothetical protein